MIDISFGGLIGAICGTIVAAALYGTWAGLIQRWIMARSPSGEVRVSQQELALLRRVILALDLLLFAGLGYWIGQEISG